MWSDKSNEDLHKRIRIEIGKASSYYTNEAIRFVDLLDDMLRKYQLGIHYDTRVLFFKRVFNFLTIDLIPMTVFDIFQFSEGE